MSNTYPKSVMDAIAQADKEGRVDGLRPKQHEPETPAKQHKYRAVPTTVDGIRFDSKKEASRFVVLKMMQNHWLISNLQTQVPYDFIINGVKVCRYVADFTYYENGVFVVEDTKGMRTREYRIKAKLMLAIHGITIKET